MLGAIIGDIIGSRFERDNCKSKNFTLITNQSHVTDGTIMTLSIARVMLANIEDLTSSKVRDYIERTYSDCDELVKRYDLIGLQTINSQYQHARYNNLAAMRVSPCAYAADTLEEVLAIARAVTEVTHNHPEGIKGAEAATAAIFLALHGSSIWEIRTHIHENYYPMNFTLDEIRDEYGYDDSCQGSVPQAIEAFLESISFEDAIRNAISIGGQSNAIASITGSIASAYYGVPFDIIREAYNHMDDLIIGIISLFNQYFPK